MRVYLTGFMGVGKTSVGRELAELATVPFLDLDREIERREGLSVRRIFDTRGEDAFRDLEFRRLRETERFGAAIVATGGGTPVFERNRELMRRLGVSVWLHLSFETVLERIRGAEEATRPLFRDEKQARELYLSRLDAYRTADHEVIVDGGEDPREVAERVLAKLRERTCDI